MVVSRLALIAGRKLAKKLATKLNRSAWRKKHYKSLKPYAIRAKSQKSFKVTKFQKSKIGGGGSERHPQQLSYGVGAKEHKINQKLASIAARRPAYKGAHHLDESWRSEMTRLFGGLHMSQDPKLVKKSIKVLAKKLKKKKIKKATEGGEVVVHANVDRSLL